MINIFKFFKKERKIEDNFKNKYIWKGLHLDVARHFMPIDYLKELICKMEKLGLNIFHLHLTDDQGWRVEIKQYPKLHLLGSKRKETVIGKKFEAFGCVYEGDGCEYGGYYTQAELRELVLFAKFKNIDIVPEIDIPGHATAMLFAYPEFAAGKVNMDTPISVATTWGVFPNVISDSEESMTFLKNILDEVMDIFPSQYIHLGGDEVPLVNYNNDKTIPEKILYEIGLYVKSKNRTPVFWDDAIVVAKKLDAIVMVWQSLQDLEKAIKQKVRAICAVSSHLYFDYYQHSDIENEPLAIGGYTSVKKVKSLEVPKSQYVIGLQAQMWTEYTKTPAEVDYMLFPRLEAFAEVCGKV